MEITTRPKTTPKDFFLYLLSSVFLYYCAAWLITLLWQYINHFYPDASFGYYNTGEWIPSAMRWAIASLLIVFPSYILITRHLNKDLAVNPDKKELRVRKWLTYLTLAVAALTIIGDLVALVFNLLEGDFAARFILKVLSILVVAGLVFGYYFYEIRRDAGKPAPRRELFRWGSVVLVTIAVIGAFFIVGSPKTARMRGYDQQRVSDLQNIQWQVVNYWQAKEFLPTALTDLNDPISGFIIPTDPENRVYEYKVVQPLTFSLCAEFNLEDSYANDRSGEVLMGSPLPYSAGIKGDSNWRHAVGRTCFERTIDPDKYPPIKR